MLRRSGRFAIYGATLTPPRNTRLEAEAIASMLEGDATLLLGNDASTPGQQNAIIAEPPRVLHLATHGPLSSTEQPLLNCLSKPLTIDV